MSVVCAVCQTSNRDGAMFCKGCAGKLPAFMATGPSGLQIVDAKPGRKRRPSPRSSSAAVATGPADREVPIVETAGFWLKLGIGAVTVLLVFFAWYAYVKRAPSASSGRPPVASSAATASGATAAASKPPGSTAANAGATGTTPPASSAGLATASTVAPPSGAAAIADGAGGSSMQRERQLPVIAGLDAGETAIEARSSRSGAATAAPGGRPANPAVAGTPMADAAGAAPATAPASAERPVSQRSAATRREVPLDPRRGCEGLSFIFAARCEAANCDKPAFTRHPRCDAVREDRRRDEARRNPTLGF